MFLVLSTVAGMKTARLTRYPTEIPSTAVDGTAKDRPTAPARAAFRAGLGS